LHDWIAAYAKAYLAYLVDPPLVLTIFDTLIDILYNVRGLPLNITYEVAVTLSKMVDALGGILG
jgi:hypothetical protein